MIARDEGVAKRWPAHTAASFVAHCFL
eukprot:SAG11_NODE_34238_length_273_cov_0.591954_1_plen_26_part_01